MEKKPKILIYDIESSPNMGYFFDVWNGTNLNFIVKERSVLTIAYKWYGEKHTTVLSVGDDKEQFKEDPYVDIEILRKFQEVLMEADYIVAHYGDKFDMPFLAGRLLINGLKPFPQVTTIDTCKLAKKHFKLNSNKLDHIAKVLKLGAKMPMNWSYWSKSMQGDIKAITKMGAYNKQDVVLLEKVFIKLLPYVETKINRQHFTKDKNDICHSCGSHDLVKWGFFYTKAGKKQRLICKKCGHSNKYKIEMEE
jgi:uncharacterized protein YprB with RNaseH-like and TPR domain